MGGKQTLTRFCLPPKIGQLDRSDFRPGFSRPAYVSDVHCSSDDGSAATIGPIVVEIEQILASEVDVEPTAIDLFEELDCRTRPPFEDFQHPKSV